MNKIMLITMLLFSVVACKKETSKSHIENETSVERMLHFQHLSHGHITPDFEDDPISKIVVIRDENTWLKFLLEINSPELIAKKIDFNTEQILIAFDKMRPHGGFRLDINSITENKTNITVTAQIIEQGVGIDIIAQPFHIVKMDKIGSSFTLREQ